MLSISTTGVLDASMCMKRYQYHFVEQLVPRPTLVKHPLRRGIWIHACLEAFHSGKGWLDVLDALEAWALDRGVEGGEVAQLKAEVTEIMNGYILYWLEENQPLVPQLTETELRYRFGDVELRATVDMIARVNGRDYVVEHKSTARLPNATWRSIDVQTAIQYVVAAANGIKVDGILFNYLNTTAPPVPRLTIKKDRFYADTAATTTAVYDAAQRAVMQEAKDDPGERQRLFELFESRRGELVNDSKFYQRWEVLRPVERIKATMRDLAAICADVVRCGERTYYPRSVHIMQCERCFYSELCAHEYTLGREAPLLRAELFDHDDGTREGRLVIPQPRGIDLELFDPGAYAED